MSESKVDAALVICRVGTDLSIACDQDSGKWHEPATPAEALVMVRDWLEGRQISKPGGCYPTSFVDAELGSVGRAAADGTFGISFQTGLGRLRLRLSAEQHARLLSALVGIAEAQLVVGAQSDSSSASPSSDGSPSEGQKQ